MAIQNIKTLFVIIAILFCSIPTSAQNYQYHAPLKIFSDLQKYRYYPGDTLQFIVKNLAKIKRYYSVESEIVNTKPNKMQLVSEEVLNAYFNCDTTFFEKLSQTYKVARKNNVGFVMPEVNPIAYSIDADSSVTYLFIVKGKRSKKPIKARLVINPDVVAGEGKNLIETKSFLLYVDLQMAGYKRFFDP